MKYYIFEGSAGRGLTDDKSGSRLPDQPGGWTYDRSVTLEHGCGPRFSLNAEEMIDAVERQGFYLMPERKPH